MRSYVGSGIREDLEKYENSAIAKLINNLREQGVPKNSYKSQYTYWYKNLNFWSVPKENYIPTGLTRKKSKGLLAIWPKWFKKVNGVCST